MKNAIDKETAEAICKRVHSIAEFCREVGWEPRGGNYLTFHKYVKEYNLDTSHFTGQRSNIGNTNNIGKSKDEFFTSGKIIKGSDIIKKLVSLGLREYKCEAEGCGISSWNGKPIQLQVHHKDGDHFNNELDNIMLLCPNCHSQTDTYTGKNRKNKGGVHKKAYKHVCIKCGKRLHKKTKTGLCIDCYKEEKNI